MTPYKETQTALRNQALSRQKMQTRYEVRTKGDGEWDYFIHPSDPEADNEANYDESNLAEARRYAHELNGWVVEISENKVPDCPLCAGTGVWDKGQKCPRCDSNVPPSTANGLVKAIVGDVEAMRCKAPEDEEEEKDDWFGPFSYFGYTDRRDSELMVQWPNLGILVAQLRELVAPTHVPDDGPDGFEVDKS